jgi:hypothetical protein
MVTRLLFRNRFVYDDGGVREIVIWEVPKDKQNWPHGLKYRCHYQHADSEQWVRYDNERGKGDHRHINTREEPYAFQEFRQLIRDFMKDVQAMRGEL